MLKQVESECVANLEDLRSQLAERVANFLAIAGGLALWVTFFLPSHSFRAWGVLAALVGLCFGVCKLVVKQPLLARYLLAAGLVAILIYGMWLFPDPWLPFLGLLLVTINAMLISGGEFLTVTALMAMAAWWTWHGERAYWPLELGVALVGGAALAWQIVRTLYTAIEWAYTMQRRADELLEEVRDHRAQLSRTLKSLELAYDLQHRTQQELISARRQAEEARRAKERFIADISHELRTPLNLILGFSEVMCLTPEVYGDMRWPLALRQDTYQIHRSSRHLLKMIDDILDLSRFDMTAFALRKEPTALAPLLREAADIAADLFRGRPAKLEVNIADDLPTLDIDQTRIRQVLLNLLSNAQRFTEVGAVRLEARCTDDAVVVSVLDTGPGIPADKLPLVFEEFYQVDPSLRRRHGGAGLGLAISKRFVEAHGGRIWAESQEGVGSTFTFSLPLSDEQRGPFQSAPSSFLPAAPPEGQSSVLLIDPDSAVAMLMRRHLARYDLIHLTEAAQLKSAVLRHHPRAIIWNVSPTGHAALNSLAGIPVPLIECSLPSQAWLSENLPMTTCLSKPLTAKQLLHEVYRWGSVQDILIVDDDRGCAQLVDRYLMASGHHVSVRRAYSGDDGLSAMRAARPDLVCLDLDMSDTDALRVLKEMRCAPDLEHVPVVLLTANNLAQDPVSQPETRITVQRPGGLASREVLDCLSALVNVLEPRYDEKTAPPEAESRLAASLEQA